MKREYVNCLLLSFAFLLLGIVDSTAQKYCKTLVFEYSSERFPITQVGEEQECLIEDITTQSYTYGELGEPYIPYLRYSIVLPDNYKISDFTYSWGNDTCKMDRIFSYPTRESLANNSPDTLVTDSIILYPVPIPIVGSGPILESPDYPLTTYPAKAWHTVTNSMIDNYKIDYFYICPFTYYAEERKLILKESIEVTVTIEPSNKGETSHRGNRDEYIKDIVCNPDDLGKGLEGWTPVSVNIIETDSGNPSMRIAISNSTFHCTAPNAAKLEVYTMDAVKVGEARFVNGEATVKVGSTPALYLYIVTYPDGHRESGKVVVNEK